ncbi:hypothetical protein EDC04DRAFT_894144 [Pisolithus marmoratus]|nr:hypothetical protein EDC04DRAFT_894144 [Pisolithus marmoratus]
MAHVASAAAWAVLTTSGYYNKSGGSGIHSCLQINTAPVRYSHTFLGTGQLIFFLHVMPWVAIGFAIFIILLVLSICLTREPQNLSPDFGIQPANTVCSGGILEVIWLASRHPAVQKEITSVRHPSCSELRKPGLFDVILGYVGGLDYLELERGLVSLKENDGTGYTPLNIYPFIWNLS